MFLINYLISEIEKTNNGEFKKEFNYFVHLYFKHQKQLKHANDVLQKQLTAMEEQYKLLLNENILIKNKTVSNDKKVKKVKKYLVLNYLKDLKLIEL